MKLLLGRVRGNELSGGWWIICRSLLTTHPTGLSGSLLLDICLMTVVETIARQLSTRVERVGLPFKPTNSPVADNQSVAILLVSDIAGFSPIRGCCCEA